MENIKEKEFTREQGKAKTRGSAKTKVAKNKSAFATVRKGTLIHKITYMIFFGMLALAILLSISCGCLIAIRTQNDYEDIAKAANFHSLSWMNQVAEGDYSYDEAKGILYKGDVQITDAAFSEYRENDKSMNHTIFWGKTRIMSDITNEDGSSIVGTELSDTTIWDTVEAKGQYYDSNVKIAGNKYTVCYGPLTNSDGTMVGMIFTGVQQDSANKLIFRDAIISVLIGFVITMIICCSEYMRLMKASAQFHESFEQVDSIATEKNSNVTSYGMQTSETMGQISAAVDQVAIAVTTQASHTEEIMGTMEEFGANIDVIVSEVRSTSEVAESSNKEVNDLQEEIEKLVQISDQNASTIQEISKQIEADSDAVGNIVKIIDVINDIAFQITILSFNASVEAARAGEVGKGFAVVADSIKDLSDKTKESLESITAIVDDVNQKMLLTTESSAILVADNEKVTNTLAETKEKLSTVSKSFEIIMQNIENVKEKSDVITVAKNEVVENISSLASMGEENAAMSEEMKSSTDEVQNITEELLTEISNLKEINNIIGSTKDSFS